MNKLSKVLVLLLALAATTAALAAPATLPLVQTHPFYAAREATASPQIKQLLLLHRKAIADLKLHFAVGVTWALEQGVDRVTGGARITDPSVVAQHKPIEVQMLKLEHDSLAAALKKDPGLRLRIPIFKLAPKPSLRHWDWRVDGMVSPVETQHGGTCYIYAAVGALECSSRLVNNAPIDASEHYLVTNDVDARTDPSTPNNGYCFKAVDFLCKYGTLTAAADPDNGVPGTPNLGVFKPYGGNAWGFCHGSHGQATVPEIKQALCDHGPVTTWIDAGGTFGGYTNGIYDDNSTNHKVGGHFVDIIGWDDDMGAWLIKNSWNTTWGDTCGYGTERGYAWVAYGCHGIGSDAVWVHAHPSLYQIDPAALATILRLSPAHVIRRVR